jgi:hypothetical protein
MTPNSDGNTPAPMCQLLPTKGASVLTISMGPEYPGLADSFPIRESH